MLTVSLLISTPSLLLSVSDDADSGDAEVFDDDRFHSRDLGVVFCCSCSCVVLRLLFVLGEVVREVVVLSNLVGVVNSSCPPGDFCCLY